MRWYGTVGFAMPVKVKNGVYDDHVEPEEHEYSGDCYQLTVNPNKNMNEINNDISMNIVVEFVADPFAYKNFMHIKYVEYLCEKWEVTNVNPMNYPRIKVTLGGLYEK